MCTGMRKYNQEGLHEHMEPPLDLASNREGPGGFVYAFMVSHGWLDNPQQFPRWLAGLMSSSRLKPFTTRAGCGANRGEGTWNRLAQMISFSQTIRPIWLYQA
jgi:hypothetical protein